MLLIETYLDESPGKGKGVFSKYFVAKGTIIWEFTHGFDIKVHIDKYADLNDVQKQFIDTYFWREGDYLLSSCDYSIFQNHSDNPNVVVLNDNKMIAARDIYPGDELVVNYKSFDDDFESYKDELV